MPKSKNRRKKPHRKKVEAQESSASAGTLSGVRTNMQQAAGRGSGTSMKTIFAIGLGVAALLLAILILSP